MLVSVVIPTYGKPSYLEEAIKSVLNQTVIDWELIIVDDNNPNTQEREETRALVQSFVILDQRIKYFQHPRNLNGAHARNTGIKLSRGSYVAFLDSDDEYLPDRLQVCVDLLEKTDDSVAGVYSGCEFRKNGKTKKVFRDVTSGNFLVETLATTYMFCTGSNIFVRRQVIKELGGFDTQFIRHQDYEFLVRLFQKYSLVATRDVLVIKNNDNLNVPSAAKMVAVKKQYLEKYKYVILGLNNEAQRYIYIVIFFK